MKPVYTCDDPRKPSEAPLARVSVGVDQGMFRGTDHLAIQAAVDYVARFGGGTVTLEPGRYVLRNAVFVPSAITLTGSGEETILQKHPTFETELAEDLDWYAWRAVVKEVGPLAVGDGITFSSRRSDGGSAMQVSRHTILGIEGNTLLLDSQPRMNHWITQEAAVVSTHSLIEAQRAEDVHISNLQLLGNGSADANLNGNHGAAIFLHDGEKVAIRRVAIRNFNGDAVSWQIVHDVAVEDCVIDQVADRGMHPGSGSQRPILRNNTIHHCRIGIFWCWGVKNGVAENNDIAHCVQYGISTGHRDTDNLIRGNRIRDCGEAAVFFRPERSAWHTSHRVRVENNRIEVPDEPSTAVGIQLTRGVEDLKVCGNEIRVPVGGEDRGITGQAEAVRPVIQENKMTIRQGLSQSF